MWSKNSGTQPQPNTKHLISLLNSKFRIIQFLPIFTPHLPLKFGHAFIYSFDNKSGKDPPV